MTGTCRKKNSGTDFGEILIAADWIVPVTAAPIAPGGLLLRDGVVTALGRFEELRSRHPGAPVHRLPPGAVMPGVINAHTHLELACLGPIAIDAGFGCWLSRVASGKDGLDEATILAGIRRAIEELEACGTAYVADISNYALSPAELAASRLGGTVFHELIGANAGLVDEAFARHCPAIEGCSDDASAPLGRVRQLLACHTPFSAGPELLRRCTALARERGVPWSLHLAESAEETELLLHGRGAIFDFLRLRGIDERLIPRPGQKPVPYIESLGCLDERLIAVHLTQASKDDLALLARRSVKPCVCPSSNRNLTGRLPPVAAMLHVGLRPALGTDSPLSGDALNLFGEMEILLDAAIDPATILSMATLYGAEALELSADYGRIETGNQPTLTFPQRTERAFFPA